MPEPVSALGDPEVAVARTNSLSPPSSLGIVRPRACDAKTPLMRQYLTLKEAHPDEVLFFRCGDFYEMFYDDAETVSKALGLALTTRGPSQEDCPMAGIPHHAVDRYLPRLIKMGFRVAISEQMEDPKSVQGKRLVERSVVEVITPGTLTDEKLLDEKEPCWLLAVNRPRRGPIGLAWLDVSTGRFYVTDVEREAQALEDELARVRPREVLLPESAVRAVADLPVEGERAATDPHALDSDVGLARVVQRAVPGAALAPAPDWAFDPDQALTFLREKLRVATLAGFDIEDRAACVAAAHALLRYAEEKKPGFLGHVRELARHRPEAHVAIDAATARCLELVETLRGRERQGSLLGTLDATRTAMGGRVLREWMLSPLRDVAAIESRQDAVEALLRSPKALAGVREDLARVYDLERLAGRSASGRATPRDLAALRDSLAHLPSLRCHALAAAAPPEAALGALGGTGGRLPAVAEQLDPLAPLSARLERSLVAQPAPSASDGEIIAAGVDPELDELRGIARDATSHLAKFQADEVERTGISSLKVGYNSVFGYYIEVTQAHRDKIPGHYVRKQTLKNCERFLTPELKELEGRILTARERAEGLEGRLLRELRDEVAKAVPALLASARAVAELDALASFAQLARERGWVRPRVAAHGAITIRAGKHPVLEAQAGAEPFVPNDLILSDLDAAAPAPGEDDARGRILVITGPNMAGKSTYIRQTALLVLMAQVGSFIPAESADVGACDRIFARVGAADDLARGLSTFMVEMTETANILRHATDRSLVVLDEVGRGTSTYDGVSIAWAIVEHLHDVVGCRALFATHYHELVGLAETRPFVANRTCAVHETRGHAGAAGDVVFLRKIVPGGADRSYGLHVARLAGVPQAVVDRAREILAGLEAGSSEALPHVGPKPSPVAGAGRVPAPAQLALFAPPVERFERLAARLRSVDPDRTTPLDALRILAELKALT